MMSSNHKSSSSSDEDDSYGPALPPHLLNKKPDESKPSLIGPQLPSNITRNDLEKLVDTAKNTVPETISMQDSSEQNNDDDESEIIGPYLPDDPRSQLIPKANLVQPKEAVPTKREEWMLICPKDRTLAVGLGPRKFLGRTPDELVFDKDGEAADDDNSDTFLETARAELANKSEQERDLQMELLMKIGSGNSDAPQKESLLSIHRKRKLLEESKSSEPKERRAFDRDVDLKVGGLSKEDKDKFIKKSVELTSRFSGGKKKYL